MAQANGLEIYNNVILSNATGVYGNGGSETLVGNVVYGNPGSAWGGSTLAIGSGNVTGTDPLIDMVSSYTIVSPLSPCVDNGIVVPGISSNYNGRGPDSGWKESGFTGSLYVHVLPPKDQWTKTISDAISLATNNSVIECYARPGGFGGGNDINGLTNVIIRSHDWVCNGSRAR